MLRAVTWPARPAARAMSSPRAMASERQSYGLIDLLRWGSACLVALGHVRNLLFVDYGAVSYPSPLLKAFYALTGLGHEAVIAFFVISGYLVGGGLIVHGSTRAALPDYFIHRFSRIYIVLLPALAITALLDLLGALAQPSLYNHPGWATVLDFSAADRHGAFILVCNAINLQDAFCPSFGSNGPLWSLAYEWFYYLTFPLVLLWATGLQKQGPTLRLITISALAILALAWVFPKYIAYYPIWLMGAVARLVALRHPLSRYWAYAALAALPVLLALARPHIFSALVTDSLIGAALAVILSNPETASGPRFLSRFSGKMAGFSYSLYVVHFPLLVFVVALLMRSGVMVGRLPPSAVAFGLFFASLALAYGFAWAFSQVTERQTSRLRGLLSEQMATCVAWLMAAKPALRTQPLPGAAPRPPSEEADRPG
jgi:peptidoglycan/LPS O-acetylase OafA/YrhL